MRTTRFQTTALQQRVRLPFPLILVGLALGTLLFNLVPQAAPFWPDEAYTVLAVRAHSWQELLRINLRNEETPPLYFVLLRLWSMLWGSSSEATLRAFSAVCIAATVPLIGRLGRQLWRPAVGVVAALLVSVNPFIHYYGQEARAYALSLLLGTALLVVSQDYLTRPTVRSWISCVIVGSLLLYTSYFAAFILSGIGLLVGIVVLLRWWQRRTQATLVPMVGWVLAQICIAATIIPWVSAVLYQIAVGEASTSAESKSILIQGLLSILTLSTNLPDGSTVSIVLLVIVAVALLLSTIKVAMRSTPYQRAWLVAVWLYPMVGGLLLLHGDSQFTPRYLFLTLPGYTLFLAAGLTQPGRLAVLAQSLLVAVVLCSALYSVVVAPSRQRQGGWTTVAREVERQAHPGDPVLFAPPWSMAAFDVQYQGPPLAQSGATSFAAFYYDRRHPFQEEIDTAALQQALAAGQPFWIVWDRTYAHRPVVPNTAHVETHRWGTTELWLVRP